ncbi:reverse transcriptase domain-containing protein [Tanacetum coccineum]
MDDEPMWAADHVVALTPGFAITIPETANEFAIKDTENEAVLLMMFPPSLTGEAKTWLNELNEGTIETWDELRTAFISRSFPNSTLTALGEIRAFSQHENESLTDAWLRIKEMLRNYHGHNLSKGNIIKIFYHGLSEITQEVLNAAEGGIFLYKTPNQAYQLLEDKTSQSCRPSGSLPSNTQPNLKGHNAKAYQPPQSRNEHVNVVFTRSGKSYNPPVNPNDQQNDSETLINFDSDDEDEEPTPQPNPKPVKETHALADLSASISRMPYSLYEKLSLDTFKPTKMSISSFSKWRKIVKFPSFWDDHFFILLMQLFELNRNNSTFDIDVIDEILEEDFDAHLNEGSKILHSIKETLLEKEIFAEFDEFMAMTANENSNSESYTKKLPFEKITINIDYKIKTSLEEPPTDLELKPLPNNLEYVFLEEAFFLPVIISSQLSQEKKNKLVSILKKHKQAFSWKKIDILGIWPSFCKHKIQLPDDKKPVVQKQRRLNPNMQEVGGITVVTNKNDELVPTRTIKGWQVCIDYRKLNEATAKDHFPLPFMDQMLERLAGNKYSCFLDGFSGYFQIPIDPNDQEKTTFTCPFGTYAYRRMPFGLCNAPTTFQRCMLAIFHDMIEEFVEVFMDDFSIFGNSFDKCLNNLDKMLQRCKDAHLVLNWEKCHFMVKEGIVLGHKVSSAGLEVDKAKIDVISKLPPPTNIKGIRSFLGHASFYQRFIKYFSKIA